MKKTISFATTLIFLISIYLLPSLSAITLGEIKSEAGSEVIDKKKSAEKDQGKLGDEKKIPEKEETDKKIKEEEKINPRLVCLLSAIVPGGGQFYLNQDLKGVGFCLAAGVGYTASGYFMVKTMLAETGSATYINYILLSGFLFYFTLVIHFVGIIEAYGDADEVNKKNLFGNDDNNPYITDFAKR